MTANRRTEKQRHPRHSRHQAGARSRRFLDGRKTTGTCRQSTLLMPRGPLARGFHASADARTTTLPWVAPSFARVRADGLGRCYATRPSSAVPRPVAGRSRMGATLLPPRVAPMRERPAPSRSASPRTLPGVAFGLASLTIYGLANSDGWSLLPPRDHPSPSRYAVDARVGTYVHSACGLVYSRSLSPKAAFAALGLRRPCTAPFGAPTDGCASLANRAAGALARSLRGVFRRDGAPVRCHPAASRPPRRVRPGARPRVVWTLRDPRLPAALGHLPAMRHRRCSHER